MLVLRKFRAIWLVAALSLTGCSVKTPPAAPPLAANARIQQLNALQQFQLSAAIGVKTSKNSVSGNLKWAQQGVAYQASMQNFFGFNVFEINNTASGATVLVDGQTHQADSASVLLDYLSGWSLPIEDMPLWLKGLAGSRAEQQRYDTFGRLTSFQLHDNQNQIWQVSYTEFFPDSLSLPKVIVLQSANTRLKLGVRAWQL